jgi:hypothetical protein
MKISNLNLITGFVGFGLLAIPATSVVSAEPKGDKTVNLTGCLANGDRTHEYSIKDQSGQNFELLPAAGMNMKKHVGQAVMVTGRVAKAKRERDEAREAGKPADSEYLRVYQLKSVNPSCS